MPILDRLISVVAPHDCIVCGAEGKLVCDWCMPDAFPELPSRCYRCKAMTVDSAVCSSCRPSARLKHVWIRTGYDLAAKDLLHLYKYERAWAANSLVAAAVNEAIPFLAAETLIIPVPTATSRARERGYDQSALLARFIARERSLLWVRAVTRLTQTRQVGASRKQRSSQLKDAFVVTKPNLVKNADILLIDDVVTTGATLEAMAAVLKQAGAKSINAAVFAQKQ